MAKGTKGVKPALDVTVVGFGQGGGRIAERFAKERVNGLPVYKCLALNSNAGDLKELTYIPDENKLSLELGGLGKNPEKAITILEENEQAKNKLNSFVRDNVDKSSELILFVAGLGGGTGTSTIVKAIEEFYDFYLKPAINTEYKRLAVQLTPEQRADKKMLAAAARQARKTVSEKSAKIGIIVTIPVRSDGPDVLRQVSNFVNQIWDLAKKPQYGIAFTMFVDNQHLSDEFKELDASERNGITTFRDYANEKIFNMFHELNVSAAVGGTDIVLDKEDFKRVLFEGTGCLVVNKVTKSTDDLVNSKVIVDMFKEAIQGGGDALHEPITLIETKEIDGEQQQVAAKVHHVGMLAVIDPDAKKSVNSSFIDDAKDLLVELLPLQGTTFPGYLNVLNDRMASTYVFYKTDGLPARLAKGLVEEFNEFEQRKKKFAYAASSIATIGTDDDEEELDEDFLADLGINFAEMDKAQQEAAAADEFDLPDIDELEGLSDEDLENI